MSFSMSQVDLTHSDYCIEVKTIVVDNSYTLVSLLIARTNFSEFSDDGIITKNSTRNY